MNETNDRNNPVEEGHTLEGVLESLEGVLHSTLEQINHLSGLAHSACIGGLPKERSEALHSISSGLLDLQKKLFYVLHPPESEPTLPDISLEGTPLDDTGIVDTSKQNPE